MSRDLIARGAALLSLGSLLGCEPALQRQPDALAKVGLPEPAPLGCEANPKFAVTITGAVYDRTGAPISGVRLGVWREALRSYEHLATTDAQGAYRLHNERPSPLRMLDFDGTPNEYCGGVPSRFKVEVPDGAQARMLLEQHNFVVPDLCVQHVQIPALPDEAPVELFVSRQAVGRSFGLFASGTTHRLRVPCDADGVAAAGAGHRSTSPGGGPPGFTPWGPDRATALTLRPAAPVRGTVSPAAEGAIVSGGLAPARVGADGAFETWLANPTGWLQLSAPGFVPDVEREVHDGEQLQLSLAPARWARVRCLGLLDDRCTVLPVVRDAAGDRPCRWRRDGHAACDLPVDHTATLLLDGLALEVPVGVSEAWFSYTALTGEATVAAASTPSCAAWAWREASLWQLTWERLTHTPRLRVVQGACASDGVVRFAPLSEGTWRLTVLGPEGWTEQRTVVRAAAP